MMRPKKRASLAATLVLTAALGVPLALAAPASKPALTAINPTAMQIVPNPAVQQFERAMEQKIEGQIRNLIGDEKVVVNVHARPYQPVAAPSPAPTAASAAESADMFAAPSYDLAYLPMAIVPPQPEPMKAEAAPSAPSPADALPAIESVEVNLQFPENAEASMIDSVKSLVNQSLSYYRPKISTTKVKMPVAKKDESKDRTPASDKPQEDPKEEMRKWMQMFALPAGLIIAAFVAGLFVFFTARAIKSISAALADGFQTIKASVEQKGADPMKAIKPEEKKENIEAKKDVKQDTTLAVRSVSRNIQAIQKMLQENPIWLVQTIGSDGEDYVHFKSVLKHFSDAEIDRLKEYLSVEKLGSIASGKGASDAKTPSRTFPEWVEGFVERLFVRKMSGGSVVEQWIEQEQLVSLFLMPANKLQEAVLALGDRTTWRIGLQFLPKTASMTLLGKLDPSAWQTVLSAADTSQEEVRDGAKRILEWADQNKSLGEGEGGADRKKFYEDSLIDPVIFSLREMELAQWDSFLDQLEGMSTEFTQLLRGRVWTPRILDRVPDRAFENIVRGLTVPQKAALISAFPEAQSQRVLKTIPEGNARTIVLDTAKKLQANADARKSAQQICREFLEFLRDRNQAGQLDLAEDPQQQQASSGGGFPGAQAA